MSFPQTVRFRSYALAFAVALAPAIMQVSCEGNTTLTRLEVEVDGLDRIVCFAPSSRSYQFSTRADDAILTVEAAQPGATTVYQWLVDGSVVDAGLIGSGGGTLGLSIPDGTSILRINVTATEGNLDRYTVDVTKLDTPEWAAPQVLATWPRVITNQGPRIGVDDAGNAVAVWSQRNGLLSSIYAVRFTAGTWGAPELLETNDTGNALTPAIAVAPNGDALVVWSQDTLTSNDEIHASQLVSGVWSGPELISALAGFDPQVALAPNGQGVAVWQERVGAAKDIRASRYDSGNWGTAELLQEDFAESPQIAIADNGDAVAVWERRLGIGNTDAYVDRLVSGVWAGPELLEFTSGTSTDLQIGLTPNGDGVAIWEQSNGILGSKRLVSGTWLFPGGQLAAGTATARFPRISVSENGDAVAVWDEGLSLYANRLLGSTGGWEGPSLLVNAAGSSNAGDLSVGVDAQGDAVATYTVIECPNLATMYVTQMTSGEWSVPERLGTGGGGEVAVDPNGNAVAVWFGLTDTEYSLQVSHRSPTP